MLTNFDDVVFDQQHTLELLSLVHVERCATTLLSTPCSVDERVANNDVVLVVARVDGQRRVARAVAWTNAQIHGKAAIVMPIHHCWG